MPQLFSNNSQSYVVAATTPQATNIVVADGDKFPELVINNNDFFLLTLVGVGTSGKEETWEIVKVTAKNSNTFTIVRGQEDTVAQSWPAVTPVECRFTAGSAAIVSADGVDGLPGIDGIDGLPGIDGAQGIEGPQGPIGEASEIFYSALPPAEQAENPLWFNTETARNYVWYEDINGGQWIQTTAEVEPAEIVIVSSETVTTVDVLTTPIGREAEQDLVNQQDVNWYLWDELETKMSLTSDQDISGDKTFTGYAYINKTSSQNNGIMPKSFILHSDSEVLTEAKIYANAADDLIKDTYLPLTGGTSHKMQFDIYMAEHRIKGLADTPENVEDAVNQKYVDGVVSESKDYADSEFISVTKSTQQYIKSNLKLNKFGYVYGNDMAADSILNRKGIEDLDDKRVSKSGDTMTGDLTVQGADINIQGGLGTVHMKLHADGQIDANKIVLDRDANQSIILKQDGVTTLELWSGGAINCQKVKVTDYDEDDLVVPKSYVDAEIAANIGGSESSVLGRAFEYDGEEDSWFRIDAGKFGLFDASSQLTDSLTATKFIVLHQDDKDGFAFHTQGLNISTMHAGTISLLTNGGRYLGAWSLDEGGTNGFTGSSSAGKYVTSIALGEWKGASSAAVNNGSTYRLSSTLWGK